MAKYKAYPEYKDSGVEWIDSIPSHWQVKPTFALCEALAKKNVGGAENNVLSLSYGSIIPRDVETNIGLLPESFNTYQIIEYGDVILRLTDLQNDKKSLRVGLVKQKGIITSAYLKLKAKNEINFYFLYRLLHSYDTTKVFYGMGGGLRQSMKFEDFRRLPLLLPPKEEQLNISAFLDHETAKIDKLIEKQKQLIELLNEKRQAVISHAVTKGLNPNVPMKVSKNTLLGKIPAHWGLTPMSFLADSITVGIVVTPAKYYKDSGVKCFRSLNVGENTIREQDWVYISEVSNNLLCKSKVYTGDILVVRSGQPGTATVVRDEFCGCNCIDLIIIRRSKRFDSNFICMQINSPFVKKQVGMASDGAIQLHFNVEVAKKLVLTEPPKEEQSEIFNFLSQKNKYFDELMKKSELQISLLQERRTALISAAVTGKIDVRDWVAPDMQDAEEPQETTV